MINGLPPRRHSGSFAPCGGVLAETKWFLLMVVIYSIITRLCESRRFRHINMVVRRYCGKCQVLLPSCPCRLSSPWYLDLIRMDFSTRAQTHSRRLHTNTHTHTGVFPSTLMTHYVEINFLETVTTCLTLYFIQLFKA